MLTKIDNGQFPEKTRVSIPKTVQESVEIFSDVNNLLKNAFIYTPEHGRICVRISERTLEISNTGQSPLDSEHIFERFYKSGGREGSMGLGLAIVGAIQRYCNLEVRYAFEGGMHKFSVRWPKIFLGF